MLLTKEEREAIRARCEADAEASWSNGKRILPLWNLDIINRLLDENEEIEADRDRWKARAEALEQCLYGMCEFCVHENEPVEEGSPCFEYGLLPCNDGRFPKCGYWEFDAAHFGDGR